MQYKEQINLLGKNTPLIIITNDDSVHSQGIETLTRIARQFGDVLVIAPHIGRSGMSMALTPFQKLYLEPIQIEEHCQIYSFTGTPVDCAKLLLHQLDGRMPDLLLSGINHGSNASINLLYSGTMAAATEGAIRNIPSIGFSINDHAAEINFDHITPSIERIIKAVLSKGLPAYTCLNINYPTGILKGEKICRQAHGYWHKEYRTETEEDGKEVFLLTGEYICQEPDATDTDYYWMSNGYAAIMPVENDRTSSQNLEKLSYLL